MAVIWGPSVSYSGRSVRMGLEMSWNATAGVIAIKYWIDSGSYSTNDSSNTLTVRFYTSNNVLFPDSTITISNTSITGSGQRVEATGNSPAISQLYGQTKTIRVVATWEKLGAINDGAVEVQTTFTVPALPYGTPAAPSNLTAIRVTDNTHALTWTNNSPNAASAPYNAILIERRTWSGGAWSTWQQVASISPTQSWQDKSTIADRVYEWRVRASTGTTTSAYSAVARSVTTPAGPASVSTSRSGNNLVVTWRNVAQVFGSNTGTVPHGVRISGTAVPNGPMQTLGSITSQTIDLTGQTGTKQLQLQTYAQASTSAVTVLSSAVTMDVVPLQAPNAPTVLVSPNPADVNVSTITVSWTHNSVDGTAQQAYEVRWRLVGATEWVSMGQQSGTATSVTIQPGSTSPAMANGTSVEFQVRTRGESASWSAWSPSRILATSGTPQATILSPANGDTVASSILTIAWAFFDPEGAPQASWAASLLDSDGMAVEQTGEAGPDTQATFATTLDDDSTYSVYLTVWDAAGLASPPAIIQISVKYTLPPAPAITGIWHQATGQVDLEITNPTAGPNEADGVSQTVERWSEAEQRWILVADQLPVDTIAPTLAVDPIPPLNDNVRYRAAVRSDIGAINTAEAIVATTADRAYLNGGLRWQVACQIFGNPSLSLKISREKTLYDFAGRTSPVEFISQHISRSWTLKGAVWRDGDLLGSWTAFEALTLLPAPICVRDPLGNRCFCSIGSLAVDTATGPRVDISVDLTEIDYHE